jgi:hypothetical protein
MENLLFHCAEVFKIPARYTALVSYRLGEGRQEQTMSTFAATMNHPRTIQPEAVKLEAAQPDASMLVLQPKADRVAVELVESDAILINVAAGTYYSTQGTGAWFWQQCAAGKTIAEIIDLACATFDVTRWQVETDLLSYAVMLKQEDLVTENLTDSPRQPFSGPERKQKLPYLAPRLVLFNHMKDLLALEPPMPRLNRHHARH